MRQQAIDTERDGMVVLLRIIRVANAGTGRRMDLRKVETWSGWKWNRVKSSIAWLKLKKYVKELSGQYSATDDGIAAVAAAQESGYFSDGNFKNQALTGMNDRVAPLANDPNQADWQRSDLENVALPTKETRVGAKAQSDFFGMIDAFRIVARDQGVTRATLMSAYRQGRIKVCCYCEKLAIHHRDCTKKDGLKSGCIRCRKEKRK